MRLTPYQGLAWVAVLIIMIVATHSPRVASLLALIGLLAYVVLVKDEILDSPILLAHGRIIWECSAEDPRYREKWCGIGMQRECDMCPFGKPMYQLQNGKLVAISDTEMSTHEIIWSDKLRSYVWVSKKKKKR